MTTNPNNAVGTNAAYSGRTSVNAFNDNLALYNSRGILSGWACAPDTGLRVVLGGNGSVRDVAIAEDNAGNRTTINNISGSPVGVTLEAAPSSNSRIDAIVAYVNNPADGDPTVRDNPMACGIIAVKGYPAASPTVPTDNDIRTAITADGSSGANAYYVVLATIAIQSGTTSVTGGMIAPGNAATVRGAKIEDGSITNDKLAKIPGNYSLNEVDTGDTWIDGSKIYKKTINFGVLPDDTNKIVAHGISNIAKIIDIKGYAYAPNSRLFISLPFSSTFSYGCIAVTADATSIDIKTGSDRTEFTECYITLYCTKTS